MKRIFAFLILSLTLTSCTASDPRTENYARAIAEITCLTLDESVSVEDADTLTEEVFETYNVEEPSDIQTYIDEITGTEAQNEMSVHVREHLESTCGPVLELGGLSAAEMAEAIIMDN